MLNTRKRESADPCLSATETETVLISFVAVSALQRLFSRTPAHVGVHESPGASNGDVAGPSAPPRRAAQRPEPGGTKPRNPRQFEAIEGGRTRVSHTFTHKNSGSCIMPYRGAESLFHALFWRQNTV